MADMDVDTTQSTGVSTQQQQPPQTAKASTTKLTRLCDAQSEHFYIYVTIEMESQRKQSSDTTGPHPLSILTFRKMLSSAVQDLFGLSMGGGINIDILGFWTDLVNDPFNRILFASPSSSSSSSVSSHIPSATLSSSEAPTRASIPTMSVKPTYSPTTAASAVLRCHSFDINQLWNALTLFNTLVDDSEARFEVRRVSSTLLGLQANSRQLKWSP
ncbi:hypothetical protein BG011_009830 [Mortierella polycephala]|uniref:Uncharacterized protein n=1 Tax=Mortierella polycephala TaxID=41804 RepID=A0A9P6PKM8_9FUNG|nr:hypothetical protein BG011_009830 [Mortierella polycephala]